MRGGERNYPCDLWLLYNRGAPQILSHCARGVHARRAGYDASSSRAVLRQRVPVTQRRGCGMPETGRLPLLLPYRRRGAGGMETAGGVPAARTASGHRDVAQHVDASVKERRSCE